MENSVQIARAMQHSDNLDSVRQDQLKNHIAATGKAPEVLAQLAACAAYARIARQAMETLVKPVEKKVGPCLAVLGDKIPDFRKINLRVRPFENARHWSRAMATRPGGTSLAAFPFHLFDIPGCRRTAIQPILNILPQLIELGRAQAVLLLHHAQGFANHFARRCIKPRRHFLPDHLLKLGSEIDIHRHDGFRFHAV